MSEDASPQENAEETEVEETKAPKAETENEEESAPSEESESDEKEEDDDKPKRKRQTAAKRISQLTWKTRELERQLAEVQKQKPAPTVEPVEYPTLESVGYDEAKHREAVDKYYKATAQSYVKESLTTEKQAEKTQLDQETKQRQYSTFFEKGLELDDGFVDMVSDQSLPITQDMADTLVTIEMGPAIMVHLAQNPDVAQEIAQQSPLRQAVELGRLEAKLSMPKAKTTTSAPAPIKGVKASGESVKKDPDKMSTEEWKKWRNNQLKVKANG